MTNIFNYLLIFNVFAGAFVLFYSPFDFYLGYVFIIFFLIFYFLRYRKFDINFTFLLILIWLTNFSLINVFFGNDTLHLMMKQVLGISITGSAYYLLVKVNKYEIEKLFKIYLRIAFVVAFIGIIQECSYLLDFKYGYDYSWIIPRWRIVPTAWGMLRVNSIFYEPSHLAISMAPAFFVSLIAFSKNDTFNLSRKASILIILCYILTFSAIAYIAIVISLLFVCYNVKENKYMLLIMLVITIFICIVALYIPEINMRVEACVGVATGKIENVYKHLSVYALVSNAFVSFKSFMSSPIFGHGLGSHPISYYKFIHPGNLLWKIDSSGIYTGTNSYDAGSLFLRLVSETGVFGVIVVFYFIFKFFIKSSVNKNLQIINNSIFVLFIAQLLRMGHYFYNGLFFFVWLYYFSYKIANKHKLAISESKNH